MGAVRDKRAIVISCRQATWHVEGTGAGLEACLRGLALLEFLAVGQLNRRSNSSMRITTLSARRIPRGSSTNLRKQSFHRHENAFSSRS